MKITKRQRKQARGPNAMVQRSLRSGEQFIVDGCFYLGKNKEFHRMPNGHYLLVAKGLPFVRTG